MNTIPPEFKGFAQFLDAQPSNIQSNFHYCLCLMMVEAGKMVLIDTVAGNESPLCLFRTNAGEEFSIPMPDISPAGEIVLMHTLRSILGDDGLLGD